jgi:hypothetical protein
MHLDGFKEYYSEEIYILNSLILHSPAYFHICACARESSDIIFHCVTGTLTLQSNVLNDTIAQT